MSFRLEPTLGGSVMLANDSDGVSFFTKRRRVVNMADV